MSEFGTLRTSQARLTMSALEGKAEVLKRGVEVRF
jgi:hypothetical protein